MNKRLTLFFILILILFSSLSIKAQIKRCGNPNPSNTVAENTLFRKSALTTIYVPVVFHVIYDNSGNGNVSKALIEEQLDTLNAAYSKEGSQYTFYLAAITRTNNLAWWNLEFDDRAPNYYEPSQTEVEMTDTLAIDTKHVFNIYISRLTDTYGWAIYFPNDEPESSLQHGVIIDYRTMPGGAFTNYNYGYTLVHEAGHYLGLYHTFQNGCDYPGDEVDDTPYQDDGNDIVVCNDNLDTCPSAGLDPVHNYMNYTDDVCYNNFTSGQVGRIASIAGQYKPNLGGTTLYFTSNYIVKPGRSLSFQPGINLAFQNGSCLIIKNSATLTANGNSSNPIEFNFISPNSSTENGIVFNNGSSGTINYCQIRNAYRGIYENNVDIDITNSAISSCTNGIYLYNSDPLIQGCNIHDNSNYGIWMLYSSSSTVLKENYIQSNGSGVYCANNSTPVIGNNSTQEGNHFSNNNYGVIVFGNALPKIGDGTYGGYNNFVNPNNNLLNTTANTVYARNNWWGTTNPANFKITGPASYTPYLTSAVTIGTPPLSKTGADIYASEEDEIPMLSELDKAYELAASGNLAGAREVCMGLINNYPDYSVSYNALNLLKETYTKNEPEAKKNVYATLFNQKTKKDLYAIAGLILADIDKENRLEYIDEVIEKYKGESVIELALFNKFVYYYFEKEDKDKAREISKELDEQFELSHGAIEAHKILGDEEYYGVEAKKDGEAFGDQSIEYSLFENYPNPFNPTTTINFSLPHQEKVQMVVYDILGRKVAELVNQTMEAGKYNINFDGSKLSSGMYIYKITAGSFTESKKMLLIK